MSEQAEPRERKRPDESWESFADRRIREAQESGEFENLPGFGRPIPGLDRPLDDNWWIRDKLKREELSVLPPILEVRLKIEKTLAELPEMTTEQAVRRRLEDLNAEIRSAHYSHIPGPAAGATPVDVERLIEDWRRKRKT